MNVTSKLVTGGINFFFSLHPLSFTPEYLSSISSLVNFLTRNVLPLCRRNKH